MFSGRSKSSTIIQPKPYLLSEEGNGILRCYNMFPTMFGSIDEMTAYLPEVSKMGFNVVWINPIQLAGYASVSRADKYTGISSKLHRSIYAMKNPHFFDPRFSVVKRDRYGNILLSDQQRHQLKLLDTTLLKKYFNIDTYQQVSKLLNKSINNVIKFHDSQEKINDSLRNSISLFSQSDTTNLSKQELKSIRKFDEQLTSAINENHDNIDTVLHGKLNIQYRVASYFDNVALLRFTKAAKKLGIAPIFDLVMNHIAKDADVTNEHPEWFKNDTSFPDALGFMYKDSDQINTIFNQFWAPYIEHYINELGFVGARIDCIRKLPNELRTLAEKYLVDLNQRKHGVQPVILEELLFSDGVFENIIDSFSRGSATHITGSVFYEKRLLEAHGNLPDSIKYEHQLKSKLGSVINFTGNHDHLPAAGDILIDVAREFLENDPEMVKLREIYINKFTATSNYKLSESVELKFLHYYTDYVHHEISFNPTSEFSREFYRRLFDKITISTFFGSGGYYLLSGDEVGYANPVRVFTRKSGHAEYPQQVHSLLIASDKITTACINALALALLNKSQEMRYIYHLANSEGAKLKLLSAYKAQVINLINGQDEYTVLAFKSQLAQYDRSFDEAGYIKLDRNHRNNWAVRTTNVPLKQFIFENNTILNKLPKPNSATTSIMLMLNEHISVTVRILNGEFRSGLHIVFINLDYNKQFEVSIKEMKTIALWLQECFFKGMGEIHWQNPNFHNAWHAVMGDNEERAPKPTLHMNSNIVVDFDVEKIATIGTRFTDKLISKEMEIFNPQNAILRNPENARRFGNGERLSTFSLFNDTKLQGTELNVNHGNRNPNCNNDKVYV